MNQVSLNKSYNATKHGVLSNLPVLPWENQNDLEDLQNQLNLEYKPSGATEQHLVLEMANCMFRKQRIYRAESALIVSRLKDASSDYCLHKEADLLAANIDIRAIAVDPADFKSLLYTDENQDREDVSYFEESIAICEDILGQESPDYEASLAKLPQDFADFWAESLCEKTKYKDKPCVANIKSLQAFLEVQLAHFTNKKNTIDGKRQIKQQAVGMAYFPNKKMESLQRYETTLDRTFERKLSMLLKIQEIRSTKPIIIDI